jgi:DNA-binding CsgD family transcriptional regulator
MPAEAGSGSVRLIGRRAECEALDRLLSDTLAGQSRVAVLRGEAGVGKSALLGYLSENLEGWHVATAVGVESEMELAYSGLHQLCARWLDDLDRLPVPQRDALETVFGRSAGPAPDRFLVGLATLTLLADAAEQQPLVCIVDDAHWLDRASAQIVGFVARRLLAERIALVCAARTGIGDDVLTGLPELPVHGLDDGDARVLLLENVRGPLDAAVCDQIVAESHGNPLALLELPRTWSAADLAGGFGLPGMQPVAGKIEQSYVRRLLQLPSDSQLLVLVAAAEPLGDSVLLRRAAEILDLDTAEAAPAVDAGLLEIGRRVEFAHPLVRSAAYRSATVDDRQRVHRALAEATNAETDPDRRAWHRARATPGPDEEAAAELERSAGRAQARGGVAAAAAFLERAALVTPDPGGRARRALAAAHAYQLAGAPEAALGLVDMASAGPLDQPEQAMLVQLRGRIALHLNRSGEAAALLLDAARRLEATEPEIARDTHLESLYAATVAGRLGGAMSEVAQAARAAPRRPGSPRAVDLLVDGLALRFTGDFGASAPILRRALDAFRDDDAAWEHDMQWPRLAVRVSGDLFDDDGWNFLATRHVQIARDAGALAALPIGLIYLAIMRIVEGKLDAAAALVDETDSLLDATGSRRIVGSKPILAAWRGDETVATQMIDEVERGAIAHGEGVVITFAEYARAVLHNGLANYEAALSAAQEAGERDELSASSWALAELAEAAARSARPELAAGALKRLEERTRVAGTDWALGIEMRTRALLDEGAGAERLYREAIDRLSRTRLRPELARAQLLYGEWLRREGRRADAREQLRTAHDLFAAIGMEAFTERARRELLATGERVRRRSAETRDQLTPQEEQIARLARDGLSNPEIGAQLFISARTVEWHLRKVFTKLGITSRRGLHTALPAAT